MHFADLSTLNSYEIPLKTSLLLLLYCTMSQDFYFCTVLYIEKHERKYCVILLLKIKNLGVFFSGILGIRACKKNMVNQNDSNSFIFRCPLCQNRTSYIAGSCSADPCFDHHIQLLGKLSGKKVFFKFF